MGQIANKNRKDLSGYFDAAASETTKKYGVVVLRWLLIIASSAVLLSVLRSNEVVTNHLHIHLIILALLVSNLIVTFLPGKYFERSAFVHTVVISDIVLISAAMWLTGSINSDFYLLYFVIIMISAVSGSFSTIIATSIVIPVIYISMVVFGNGTQELLKTETLLRVPFFFVSSVFYGYLVSLVRKERVEKKRYQEDLSTATYITELSQRFSESLDRSKILELLVEAERQLCAVSRATVISRMNRKIVADSAKEKSVAIDKSFFEFVENTISTTSCRQTPAIDGQKKKDELMIQLPQFTLVPVENSWDSDLYLILFGVKASERLQYSRVLLVNSCMALKNAGQYQALVREANKRKALAEQLSDALESKSKFLSNMSHELRTPISSLIGFSELLLDNDYGKLSKEQSSVVSRMLSSSEELQSLVSKIIGFSRLDSGEIASRAESGSTEQFVKKMYGYARSNLTSESTKIELELSGNLPALVIDWPMIEKVMVALISNALKFTEEGVITLSVDYDRVKCLLNFKVSDTGIGIDQEQLADIFRPFRHIDSTYNQQSTNSGLGLAITKKQVELMGGGIEAKSTPGIGSEFLVTIPADPALSSGTVDQQLLDAYEPQETPQIQS